MKRATVDLEHGVVDFDYVRLEPVVIVFIHALNPERDMHRGCTTLVNTATHFSLRQLVGCNIPKPGCDKTLRIPTPTSNPQL